MAALPSGGLRRRDRVRECDEPLGLERVELLDEAAVEDRHAAPRGPGRAPGREQPARRLDLGRVGGEEAVRGLDRPGVNQRLPVEAEVATLPARGREAGLVVEQRGGRRRGRRGRGRGPRGRSPRGRRAAARGRERAGRAAPSPGRTCRRRGRRRPGVSRRGRRRRGRPGASRSSAREEGRAARPSPRGGPPRPARPPATRLSAGRARRPRPGREPGRRPRTTPCRAR